MHEIVKRLVFAMRLVDFIQEYPRFASKQADAIAFLSVQKLIAVVDDRAWEATDCCLNATSLATTATIRCAYALAVAECMGRQNSRALATTLRSQQIPNPACLAASCMQSDAAAVVGRLLVSCGPRLIASAPCGF